ncbi:biotin synthase BioB [Corynebacterium macclintockiae]|nr:biotin synthase BioB [Corynebacterium macclintockiae]MDK8869552.1 biotin synthase BioB [Corynebacterium macclintockiae]
MTTAETNAAKTPTAENPAKTPATENPAQTPATDTPEILNLARTKVLENGEPLNYEETLQVLQLGDEHLDELLDLAHQVRLKWCGDAVEMEGIISLQTGGCPEDCHFCAQSGLFESPVRSIQLDIAQLVEAAKQTAKTGATEFCIVAAVKGPDEDLMNQMAKAIAAIQAEVDINVAASIGILTQEQVDRLKELGVHRYNHNLETCKSYFPEVVTTHTWEERTSTLEMVRDAGMEVCCGGIVGMGETVEQRAEFAIDLQKLDPTEVPLNFFDPRPGTPFADLEPMPVNDALRTIGAFRLALPRQLLRFAGGRELTLGDLGAEKGLLGGINAVIVGNYLTTLGRPAERDVDMLGKLQLPIKALNATL